MTQRRLRDLADRISEWEQIGADIQEYSAAIIEDIAAECPIEPGPLDFETHVEKLGNQVIYRCSVTERRTGPSLVPKKPPGAEC